MKFKTEVVTSQGRTGEISGIQRLPELRIETPALFMHTRGGNIPHITHEVLELITKDPLVMHMPITTLIKHIESISEHNKGIAQFVGLQEYPVYMTPQDPAVVTPAGYNIKDSVAIWARTGKIDVNPKMYMMAVEIMRPDMYLALCDGDTNHYSSIKRVTKSLQRSVQMFKDCIAYHNSSLALRNSAIIASIEGGYDLAARKASIDEMTHQPVCGFVIDGLHNNGPDTEEISFTSLSQTVTECVHLLPSEKFRIAHGAWNPVTLLHLVAAGIDVFDASFVYLVTERKAALSFPFKERFLNKDLLHDHCFSSNIEVDFKRHLYEIYVEDDRYAEDFNPFVKDCLCLACQQHTKAYVHHLLKTKELLGTVLLMIHNLHHYLEFFKVIRNAIRNNSFPTLFRIVSEYCQTH